MTEAADYFLKKQNRSLGIPESEKVKIAIKSLGLDDLESFDPNKKIIEYMMRDDEQKQLIDMDLRSFADETASESPAPGGGSVAAYCGTLGISLATMVANLSAHKRGWDDKWDYFSEWAVKGENLKSKLLATVDEDTEAFSMIMKSFGLPKNTEAEKKERSKAIADATRHAAEVPLRVAKLATESFEIIEAMVNEGNPNSITDGAVGAICARAAVKGAVLNVRVNLQGFEDKEYVERTLKVASRLEELADKREKAITDLVNNKLL
jgi:glutamate formiminotransferase/formiminotetrahydrofolate cyclodeaminase